MIGQGYDNKWDLISNTKYTILKVKYDYEGAERRR